MYPELETARSWYSISLPFHHPSTYDGSVTDEALDEHILAELIHRAIGEFVPGGPNYAAKFPGRVRSVVSVGGLVAGRTFGLEGALEFISAGNLLRRTAFFLGYRLLQSHRFFYKLATLSYARRWRNLLRYPELDPTINNVFPDVRRHPVAGQRAWGRFLLGVNLWDELDRITCPVLVVAGSWDPVIPYAHQKKYAGLLPNARLVVLERVGHVPFGEAPGRFKKEIVDWLTPAP